MFVLTLFGEGISFYRINSSLKYRATRCYDNVVVRISDSGEWHPVSYLYPESTMKFIDVIKDLSNGTMRHYSQDDQV